MTERKHEYKIVRIGPGDWGGHMGLVKCADDFPMFQFDHDKLVNVIEEKLREAMDDGWIPVGSLLDVEGRYLQPMIREVK